MSKTLCKLKSKKKKASRKRLFILGEDSTHICRKCGRYADSKKKLCKPEKLT